MEKNTIIIVVIAVLVVIAAVQAVELSMLKSKIEVGGFKVGSRSTTVSATAGSPTTGSSSSTSIDDLQGMVGGC